MAPPNFAWSIYYVSLFCVFFLIKTDLAISKNIDEEIYEYDHFEDMVELKGGEFRMGVNDPKSLTGEYPVRKEGVKPFAIDKYPVTNAQFRMFTQHKRRYRTDAQRQDYSYVFFSQIHSNATKMEGKSSSLGPWWIAVKDADWIRPEGRGSSIRNRLDYPVIHASFHDAISYCHWAGKRLPTEYEWEYATRGGLNGKRFPWGDSYKKNRMNLWQGLFPGENQKYDGWAGVSPVEAYPPQNEYGMYDMLGNAWEWTSTRYYVQGVPPEYQDIMYVLRGGSFIDSKDGNVGQTVGCSTRNGQPPEFVAQNVGFRCAYSIKPAPIEKTTAAPPARKPRRHRKEDTYAYKMKLKQQSSVELMYRRDEL